MYVRLRNRTSRSGLRSIGEWRSREWSKRDRPTAEQQLLARRRRTLPRVSNQLLPRKLKLNALSLYPPPCFSSTSTVTTTHHRQRCCRRRVTIYSLRILREASLYRAHRSLPSIRRPRMNEIDPKTPLCRCTLRLCSIFLGEVFYITNKKKI